ncbi:MAG TPA: aspartate aminotransferase family protein [Symbiobacteriaceae bacterium]|nr:aspartate aminotransferase family protein [Symbiobacteriaceae bacterium]
MKHVLQCHPVAPVEIVRAQGDSLYDRNGKRYIDFEAGIWCNALGHNHPRTLACLHRQADAVMHLGPLFSGSLTEAAATALLRHTPHPDGKVTFLSSGSEAVETGIRLARRLTGRRRLLSLGKSYLGAYGESSQDSAEVWTKVDLTPCLTCPLKECSARCPNLSHVEPEQTAAFVFEPVLASGGILVAPPKLVRLLVGLVQEAGGLVVVDEVTTGFGRTGTWWGFEQDGVTPDIIACGKSLGNGYPVSAVIVSPAVAEAAERAEFRHSQSHQNDPLAAAMALEVIQTFEEERVLELVPAASAALVTALRGLESPLVADVRGLGLMYGLELTPGLVDVVWPRMLHRGFMVGFKSPLSLLRFLPPLVVGLEGIAEMGAALRQVLAELE